MTNNEFKKLVERIGNRIDYFQGAGGNVSLKNDVDEMLIKASGKRVSDMILPESVVNVVYQNVRTYFHMNEAGDGISKENESADIIKKSVVKGGDQRPSMETGFHALLGNAVLHTHSVYVNLLTCSETFPSLVESLFPNTENKNVKPSVIEYATPGHFLTHKVKDLLTAEQLTDSSTSAQVIFMKNHGIIVSASTLDEAINIHEAVNQKIIETLKLQELFPSTPNLKQVHETHHESSSSFLQKFSKENANLFADIKNAMLFPDLVVFCKQIEISESTQAESKIVVNPTTGSITYNTSAKEAAFIEENLLAWAYLMKTIPLLNLTPQYLFTEDMETLENMEAEKYRKKMVS